ncbi:MAG: hypothetical protein ACKVS8_02965 [Phycisphaerales bacterium]
MMPSSHDLLPTTPTPTPTPALSPEELAAWRATPEYLSAREFGIDMEVLEFLQTLSAAERIERNDRFAALVSAARASQVRSRS